MATGNDPKNPYDGRKTDVADNAVETAETGRSERSARFLAVLKFAVLVVLLVGVPLYIFLAHPEVIALLKDREALESFLEAHRSHSLLILFAFQIVQIVIAFIPGQAAQFAGGYAVGILPGYLVCMAGVIVGTALSYVIARLLGRDFVAFFFSRNTTADIEAKMRSGRAHALVFVLYLIPMLPKDAVAYVAGACGYPLRLLLVISTVARTPAMLLGIAMGAELRSGNHAALIVLACVSAAILAVCVWQRKNIEEFANKCFKK